MSLRLHFNFGAPDPSSGSSAALQVETKHLRFQRPIRPPVACDGGDGGLDHPQRPLDLRFILPLAVLPLSQ